MFICLVISLSCLQQQDLRALPLQELRATRVMWYVSTLLGLIRHAYWWGDKKWEKLSNLMPSSVTFHFSCCRKISLLQIIDSSSCVSEGRKDCYIHPQILQWYTIYFLKQQCIRNVGFLSPFGFGIVTPSFDLSAPKEKGQDSINLHNIKL